MVQVKVTEGILEGEEFENEYGGKFFSFKGIPYAQPPIRDLRFKAPQPVQSWKGVRSAKKHGNVCYQHDVMFLKSGQEGSEDCLYLNVYTPDLNPSEPLPVMFFIHGGGFMSGSGNDDVYGPKYLIKHNVILVTINYRLDIFGFLCLDSPDIPGNAGMKDQVAALHWVKNNISNFGGNPENITIFGESAGGASVTLHLVSPMSKGLFKRAISQSGAATSHWVLSQEPRERAKALARSLGLDSDDDKELYEFFKSQPAEALLNKKPHLTLVEEVSANIRVNFGPVSEKKFSDTEVFFSGDMYDTLRNGGVHEGVDVMAGYNQDEGYMVVGVDVDLDKLISQFNEYPELFVPREIAWNCSKKTIFEVGRKMREFYFKDQKIVKENLHILIEYLSMDIFVYGIVQWQKLTSTKNNAYLYKFTCCSELNVVSTLMGIKHLTGEGKVVHADDLGYFFYVNHPLAPKIPKDSYEYKLIDRNTTLWTNFAKFGNPTPDSSLGVQWKPFTVEEEDYLDLGNQLVNSKKPNARDIEFWESIFKQYYPHCLGDTAIEESLVNSGKANLKSIVKSLPQSTVVETEVKPTEKKIHKSSSDTVKQRKSSDCCCIL
ncbi:hypothetical protein O0L34_g5647 [Tuta absoluta]|nr:hypothetical protein O0L34_g5647 [Tuta absoluta]